MAHWFWIAGGGVLVVAVFVFVSACSPIVALNRIVVDDERYVVQSGIPYGPDARQKLDVYTPREMIEPARLVIFFYGGGWQGGKRQYYPFLAESLTGRGFVVVVADYRVYPEVRFPQFVEDAALAVRWVSDNAKGLHGNSSDIVLMGHSAGAHIASLLVTDDRYLDNAGVPMSDIRGFIGLAGPYAFDPLRSERYAPIFAGLTTAETMQPGSFVTGGEPPMLLLHGLDDSTVKVSNSRSLGDAVRQKGGQVNVVEYSNLGHVGLILAMAQPFARRGGVLDTISEFIAAR